MATRFNQALEAAIQKALIMPSLGTPSTHGTRLWRVRLFPYTLVYRVDKDVLSIFAVAHQRRKPGYWAER